MSAFEDELLKYKTEENETGISEKDVLEAESPKEIAPSPLTKFLQWIVTARNSRPASEAGNTVSAGAAVMPQAEPAPGPGNIDGRFRIAMLGLSGAGKSVVLSGIHQNFVLTAENGFSLRLDPSENVSGYHRSLCDVAIYDGEQVRDFPPGTQNSSVYVMELMHEGKKICNFEFIDYKGGSIRDLTNPELTDSDSQFLRNYLLDSDVIFVFLDAVKLGYYPTEDSRRLHCKADLITSIYLDLVRNAGHRYHVVTLLSKADDSSISQADKENGYQGLVDKAAALTTSIKANAESFLILPVSGVGEGRTTTTVTVDRDGTPRWQCNLNHDLIPKPFNIDLAMLYACQLILRKRISEMEAERKMMECLSEKDSRRDPEARRARQQQMQAYCSKIMDLMEHIEAMSARKADDWIRYIILRKESHR